jgi:uncharacterized protein YehS (DUF1456 family)
MAMLIKDPARRPTVAELGRRLAEVTGREVPPALREEDAEEDVFDDDTFDFSDPKMMSLFDLVESPVSREQVSAWLKKDDDPEFQKCSDRQLASFLNGLIIDRRGRKEGPLPEAESRLNNNIILRKLKIALDLQAEDMLEILSLSGLHISKHELSAFFRKPGHKHFRECKDQVLRNFLHGIQLMYREE